MLKATTDQKRDLPSDQNATGRTLGEAELQLIAQAISSGTLTSTKGTLVKRFETAFAERLGIAGTNAHACTSGTAALHTAIAAINPEPGDEIVTTSITDMGALTPMLYQGAIPVFADVDPRTYNVTAETIEAHLSERTKAIMVTHLFGNPCQMDEIMELAQARIFPSSRIVHRPFMPPLMAKRSERLATSVVLAFNKASTSRRAKVGSWSATTPTWPGDASSSSIRPGATGTRIPTTISSRSTIA